MITRRNVLLIMMVILSYQPEAQDHKNGRGHMGFSQNRNKITSIVNLSILEGMDA